MGKGKSKENEYDVLQQILRLRNEIEAYKYKVKFTDLTKPVYDVKQLNVILNLESELKTNAKNILDEIEQAYKKSEITADDALGLLYTARSLLNSVKKGEAINLDYFLNGIKKDTTSSIESKNAYHDSKIHAISGLMASMAIVAAVMVSLALAGPSMGVSLIPLLALALSGAGFGIPKAVEGHNKQLESEKNKRSEENISDYAKKFKEVYKDAFDPSSDKNPELGSDYEDEFKL